MSQILLTKTSTLQKQKLLTVNTPEVDQLFAGFAPGDFAVVNSTPAQTYLTSLLCVRAQLPTQLGGLNSDVVFIDCAASVNRTQILRIAQLYHLNIKQAADKIHLLQASTAYEATSLLLDGLKSAIEKYNAKLAIISNIGNLFLNEAISEEEAQRIFSQIASYLQSFARRNQIIIISTYNPRPKNNRNINLQTAIQDKANIVISLTQTLYDREFILEKHPRFVLGCAEFPDENLTLNDFF